MDEMKDFEYNADILYESEVYNHILILSIVIVKETKNNKMPNLLLMVVCNPRGLS